MKQLPFFEVKAHFAYGNGTTPTETIHPALSALSVAFMQRVHGADKITPLTNRGHILVDESQYEGLYQDLLKAHRVENGSKELMAHFRAVFPQESHSVGQVLDRMNTKFKDVPYAKIDNSPRSNADESRYVSFDANKLLAPSNGNDDVVLDEAPRRGRPAQQ